MKTKIQKENFDLNKLKAELFEESRSEHAAQIKSIRAASAKLHKMAIACKAGRLNWTELHRLADQLSNGVIIT